MTLSPARATLSPMKITFRHTSQTTIDPLSAKKLREVSAEVFDELVYAGTKPIVVATVSSETATVADATDAALGKRRQLDREVVKEAARCGWVSLRDHATYTRLRSVVLAAARGPDFDWARAELRRRVSSDPLLAWVAPLMPPEPSEDETPTTTTPVKNETLTMDEVVAILEREKAEWTRVVREGKNTSYSEIVAHLALDNTIATLRGYRK